MPGTTIESAAVNSDFSDIATALTDSVAADGQTTMTGALKLADGTLSQPALTFGSSTGKGIANLGAGSMSFIYGGAAVLGINFAAYGVSGNVVVQGNPSGGANVILMPVGAVMDFAGAAAPAGWLLCFGQSVLRSDYPELFAALGTTYGAADSAHFTLPDYRGRISPGVDNMGGSAANRVTNAGSGIVGTTQGAVGGAQNQTATTDQIPAHAHPVSIVSGVENSQHTHGLTFTTALVAAGANTQVVTNVASGSTFQTNVESATHTHTVSGNTGNNTTAGSAITTMPPAIMMNKIIFAAR